MKLQETESNVHRLWWIYGPDKSSLPSWLHLRLTSVGLRGRTAGSQRELGLYASCMVGSHSIRLFRRNRFRNIVAVRPGVGAKEGQDKEVNPSERSNRR